MKLLKRARELREAREAGLPAPPSPFATAEPTIVAKAPARYPMHEPEAVEPHGTPEAAPPARHQAPDPPGPADDRAAAEAGARRPTDRYPTTVPAIAEPHDGPLTVAQLLADLIARNPKPNWRAEHDQAAVAVAASPVWANPERILEKHRRRAVTFDLVADLDKRELARDTLALLAWAEALGTEADQNALTYWDEAGAALDAHEASARRARVTRRAA